MATADEAKQLRGALRRWYRRHGRDLPWRHRPDPYAVMVSEFMLQQTTVATVAPRFQAWMRRFPTLASVARASESDVLHAWQGLGYYSRARNLHRAVQQLAGLRDFPRDVTTLRQLPGCGEYTANAIAAFAFDKKVPVVEANIARVLCRLFDIRTRIDSAAGRRQVWRRAEALLPGRRTSEHHSALMDLGALVCVSREPHCRVCPLVSFCRARNPHALPHKAAKPKLVRREEIHALVVRRDQILLERASTRWKGLWVLPRHRSLSRRDGSTRDRRRTGRLLRSSPPPIYHAQFPYTHHRITLKVYRGAPLRSPEQRWFSLAELPAIPMPTPHRRALEKLFATAPKVPPPPRSSHSPSAAPVPPENKGSSACRK